MKKFEKFKMNSSSMNNLIGGLDPVGTTDSWKNEEGCTVNKTDTFDDCNNNGIWDKNEKGTVCTETICK